MKKFFAFVSLALLVACGKVASEDSNIVNVTISVYEMTPITKAALSTYTSYIDVFVTGGDDESYAIHQSKEEAGANFGTVNLPLDKTKTYSIDAVAHKSVEAYYNDGVISFKDNKVGETFYGYVDSYCPNTHGSVSVELNRMIGRFRLETTDAFPEEVTQMRFTIYETPTAFAPHVAIDKWKCNIMDREVLYTSFTTANDGTAAFNVSILERGSSNGVPVDIKIEALDADNNVVRTKNFTNVPIKRNYITTYRGSFFVNGDVPAGMSCNDWQTEDNTIEF